jgi:hypothetical protein
MSIAALALVMELRPLRDLAAWESVAALFERVVDAARGGSGLTPGDVEVARRWVARWNGLPTELRTFYSAEIESLSGERAGSNDVARSAVVAGLWRILEGYPIAPWQTGILRRRFEERLGRPSAFEIAPVPEDDPRYTDRAVRRPRRG